MSLAQPTRTHRRNCRVALLAPAILAIACGGGGGNGGGSAANSNGNGSGGNGAGGGNTNDNSAQQLQVQIQGLPAHLPPVGQSVVLSAGVTGSSGTVQYQWTADPPNAVTLTGATTVSVTALVLIQTAVVFRVSASDSATAETAQADATLAVAAAVDPPVEATLSAQPVVPVGPNVLVTLIAVPGGPPPTSVVWTPHRDNILSPEVLTFIDSDPTDAMAIFFSSDLLMFTYELTFTVTATYENGGTLSDSVTVLVQGLEP